MKFYKSAVGIRGDCLYCPLPLSIDSYWNCLTDCYHCYFRRLNRTWGTDLRPTNPDIVARKLENGLKNKNPKSSLAWALKLKKTLRLGNKSDAFQDVELKHGITKEIMKILIDKEWTFVIQTKFLHNMMEYIDLIKTAHKKGLVTILPIISPGLDWDWKYLERKRTTGIQERGRIIKRIIKKGIPIGVNGEPFIPGLHTINMFTETLDFLKNIGIKSYNIYNLHFNDYVAKNFHSIGLDIEKIWEMNQDKNWKPIQKKLCQIAKEKKMILGCPDFVNTGWLWPEKANTCCGITVQNPSRFNTHHWKRLIQKGKSPKEAYKETWEGIGDRETAQKILKGKNCDLYTMKNIII